MLQVIQKALRDVWGDLFTTVVCNLLWLVSQVLILPGPPATLALFYAANRLANGEPFDLGDYLRAVRRYFGLGWRWGAANLLVLLILAGDFILTGRMSQSSSARFAQGLYLALLAGWALWQVFSLAFLFQQETLSLRQAWRNGVVLIGRNLVWSLGLALLVAAVLLVGAALFLLSGAAGGIFVALVGTHAVLDRLNEARPHPPASSPEADPSPPAPLPRGEGSKRVP